MPWNPRNNTFCVQNRIAMSENFYIIQKINGFPDFLAANAVKKLPYNPENPLFSKKTTKLPYNPVAI